VEITRGYEAHIAGSRAREVERSSPVADVAPCNSRCPLYLCIQGYIGHIAAGEHRQALEHILARCPLPETVCRVCHRPCEEACIRTSLGESAVAINDLKRHAVHAARDFPYDPPREPDHGRSVAVVGAGPSGLCAAHDLRLRGYTVTLIDAGKEPGGLLLSGIPAFRLPREPLRRDVQRILDLGVTFKGETFLGRDISLAALLESHQAVYLAVGAHLGLQLGLAGDEEHVTVPHIVDALAYLHQANLGQAEQLPSGQRVVVVGGGNAAIDAARIARRFGAQRVTIAYRRRREEMPALPEEVEAAVAEGIDLQTQLQPLSIFRGNKPGLECIRTRPGQQDSSGRQRPVPVGGTETVLEAELIIVAIGQSTDPAVFAADPTLDLERAEDGTLKVDSETGRTSHPQIYAGGDLVQGERTVTWAMAQGQRAAWAIDRALRGADPADRRPPPPIPASRKTATEGWPHIKRADRSERQRPGEIAPSQRTKGFEEVVKPLTEEQARAEARRCLVCGLCGNCRSCIDLFGCPAFYMQDGLIDIDRSVCTGCGFCADFCPNNAIRPVEEGE
jgi:NADPH-dependent glutamate synthase beta subunit-like oxidoreductase